LRAVGEVSSAVVDGKAGGFFTQLVLPGLEKGGTLYEYSGFREIFTFGYDYFALIMCIMTSLIFSFVFLVSIYQPRIGKKKLFFVNLLAVELSALGAFLSLNLLGFFIFFESGLLSMALIIGYWGSSNRRWMAARQFLFYSLAGSLPMMFALIYCYNKFGSLDYLYLYSQLPLLSVHEKF
jgi:NADH:ubiquinone oxidoreductase subunit 4 (subunit M)